MKKSKRNPPGWKRAYDRHVGGFLHDIAQWLDRRFQTRRRLKCVNLWASEHPKRFFRYAFGVLGLVFLTGLLAVSYQAGSVRLPTSRMEGAVSEIERTSSMIDRLRSLQSRKSEHDRLLQELILRADRLKHEVDSISGRKPLSHKDSVEISRRIYQLDIITKTLIPDEKN